MNSNEFWWYVFGLITGAMGMVALYMANDEQNRKDDSAYKAGYRAAIQDVEKILRDHLSITGFKEAILCWITQNKY